MVNKTLKYYLLILFVFIFSVKPVSAATIEAYYQSDAYLFSSNRDLTPYIHDVNGDGKKDLIMIDNGNIYIYFNGNIPLGFDIHPEATTSYNLKITNTGVYFPQDVLAFADFTNDGKDDTVFVAQTALYIFDANHLNTFSSQTNQTFNLSTQSDAYITKVSNFNTMYGQYGPILFVKDMDNDGKADIEVVDTGRNIYYLNNSLLTSGGTSTLLNVSQPTGYTLKITTDNYLVSNGGGVIVSDISNDGKPDIIAILRNLSNKGSLNVLLGSKIASFTGTGNVININADLSNVAIRFNGESWPNTTFDTLDYEGVAAADLTEDGKNDLIVSTSLTNNGVGRVNIYSNEKFAALEGTTGTEVSINDNTQYLFSLSGTNESWTLGAYSQLYVGDINENGKKDFIIANEYDSSGGCSNCGAAYIIDDSLLNTFTHSTYPNNSFSLTDGNNYFARISGENNQYLSSNSENAGGIEIVDFNTDGKTDLIVASNGEAYYYLSSRLAALGTTKNNQLSVTDSSKYDRKVYNLRNRYGYIINGEITGDEANDLIFSTLDVFIFKGGSKIINLDAALSVVLKANIAIDPEVSGQVGTKDILLQKGALPIAVASTSFANIDGLNWSGVTADTDAGLGKTVVVNLASAGGVSSHDIYVKKTEGSIGVRICPDATTLVDITLSCSNGVDMTNPTAGLSSETIDSVEYWKVSNTSQTGVMNISDTTPPTGNISVTSGLANVNSRNVSFTLNATDTQSTVSFMMLSEDQSFVGAQWIAYANSKIWNFTSDGSKELFVKYKDNAGNISDVYSVNLTIDTVKPTILITQIGLIQNVPNKNVLFYYFTSQTPQIKGASEANSVVHFRYGSEDYTATANGTGNFQITIPELPRKYVLLTYYSVDLSGNQSDSKTLKFVIGEENFPQDTNTVTTENEPTEEPTPSPTEGVIPPTETETPEIPQKLVFYLVDQDGKSLSNTKLFIDGQEYKSDSIGKVVLEAQPTDDMKIEVEVLGEKYAADILGDKIETNLVSKESKRSNILVWVVIIVIIVVGGLAFIFKRNAK